MSFGSRIIFGQLFQQHGQVRIPIIQRDYAQGREAAAEVREDFLSALEEALRKPTDDPTLPLNLDFVYGSVEGIGETRFFPLDGQQRLTTLFLLHWYLAWADDEWSQFEHLFQSGQKSRFAYSVRPSSNEFFDRFVNYQPVDRPDDPTLPLISKLISDQSWYFRSWRLDPTIQSVFGMLDAIHKRFASATGLFQRLIDESLPAITFQLLDLKDFGLSDDLYIKMNARGKPLTDFENFKARYEQELENQFADVLFPLDGQTFSAAQYVALRMDTAWTDLVWGLRDKKSSQFDGAFLNIFRAVVLVTRNPDDDNKYLVDLSNLRDDRKAPSFPDFLSHKWLDESFTLGIIRLFDAWSREQGKKLALLPNARYFDERAMFDKIAANGAKITYSDVVQFAAYLGFVSRHHAAINPTAFQEWMRIACTLSEYTVYNRADDFRRSIVGLRGMLEHSGDILKHFADSDEPATGFNLQQIAEEKLKAELILANPLWRDLINRAEEHGYFHSQIEFLLDFSGARAERENSGAPAFWTEDLHSALQDRFSNYLRLAEQMFTRDGLQNMEDFRWQRALLSIGDYLLPQGRNYSFLVNAKDDEASWKRPLRGSENVPAARKVLHRLWDKLNPDQPFAPQLDDIITTEAPNATPWRTALAQTPSAIAYCQNQSLRIDSDSNIYLLVRKQMNGAHAELFTYCLYQNTLMGLNKVGRLQPLRLAEYITPAGTDVEPGIRLEFSHKTHTAYFDIEFEDGQYKLFVSQFYLEKWPGLLSWLKSFGFSETEGIATRFSSSLDIETLILDLAKGLMAAFPSPNRMP